MYAAHSPVKVDEIHKTHTHEICNDSRDSNLVPHGFSTNAWVEAEILQRSKHCGHSHDTQFMDFKLIFRLQTDSCSSTVQGQSITQAKSIFVYHPYKWFITEFCTSVTDNTPRAHQELQVIPHQQKRTLRPIEIMMKIKTTRKGRVNNSQDFDISHSVSHY